MKEYRSNVVQMTVELGIAKEWVTVGEALYCSSYPLQPSFKELNRAYVTRHCDLCHSFTNTGNKVRCRFSSTLRTGCDIPGSQKWEFTPVRDRQTISHSHFKYHIQLRASHFRITVTLTLIYFSSSWQEKNVFTSCLKWLEDIHNIHKQRVCESWSALK